jgi:heme oxygenase
VITEDVELLPDLRAATAQGHAALEAKLDILSGGLTVPRLEAILRGFASFHRAWEPRVSDLIADPGFFDPRRRLALLEADLGHLAGPPAGKAPDLAFLEGADEAWGSIYVVEGSTLGSLVIAKALASATCVSGEAPRYFSSRGRDTAHVWKQTCSAIEARGLIGERSRIVAGAVATFDLLAAWLPEGTTSNDGV